MILLSDGSFFVYESAQRFREFVLSSDPIPPWIFWRCKEMDKLADSLLANRDKELLAERTTNANQR